MASRSQGNELFVTDNSDGTYTVTRDGLDSYEYITDDSRFLTTNFESKQRTFTAYSSPSVSIESDGDAIGGKALYLNTQDGNVDGQNRQVPYGSIFGPYVVSDAFNAKAGDVISLDLESTRV